jgi:transposase
VLQHARLKYACKAYESTVRTAVLPAQPIPKSNASADLLAYVATAKYQDALPLHRQESIFKRMEVDIPRNTLANWMMRSGELMAPLIAQLDGELRSGKIIQCDETPLQVLNEADRPASSQSYMWVRRSGTPDHPIVLYDYAASRAGSVAEKLLSGFSGYLQTDGYAGHHATGRQHSINHVGCWAHARRKFVDAQKAATSKDKRPPAPAKPMWRSIILPSCTPSKSRRKTRAAKLVASCDKTKASRSSKPCGSGWTKPCTTHCPKACSVRHWVISIRIGKS